MSFLKISLKDPSKVSYVWIGFFPTVMFIFGKCAGFIPWSWLWIIIPICMWYKKRKIV
jgi:hypothetical protein